MSIETKHVQSSPFSFKHKVQSRVSLTEILDDFKTLDDLDHSSNDSVENSSKKVTETTVRAEYKKYLQLQDFRRPKLQECVCTVNKYQKLNRSYTVQEIRENGLQLIPPRGKSQCIMQNSNLILSEYIL